jgi:hypothetical protein
MPLDDLAKLNTEQRRAVGHGVGAEAGGLAAPLLVIAGAGSGKTNTLAHRVADPAALSTRIVRRLGARYLKAGIGRYLSGSYAAERRGQLSFIGIRPR